MLLLHPNKPLNHCPPPTTEGHTHFLSSCALLTRCVHTSPVSTMASSPSSTHVNHFDTPTSDHHMQRPHLLPSFDPHALQTCCAHTSPVSTMANTSTHHASSTTPSDTQQKDHTHFHLDLLYLLRPHKPRQSSPSAQYHRHLFHPPKTTPNVSLAPSLSAQLLRRQPSAIGTSSTHLNYASTSDHTYLYLTQLTTLLICHACMYL